MDKEKIDKVIKNIYKSSLGCKQNEKIFIFTDHCWLKKSPDNLELFELFKTAALSLGLNAVELIYEDTGRHGAEPPESLWEASLGKQFMNKFDFSKINDKKIDFHDVLKYSDLIERDKLPDIVIALSYYSTSHTNFRKTLNALGVRYASMPGIEEEMFYSSLDVDFLELEKETLENMLKMQQHNSVIITSPAGTDIYINYDGREVKPDTGILGKPGSFGNLPAGEVYVAPNENRTQGVFVVEYAASRRLEPPLEIFVKAGKIVRIEGDSGFKAYLESILELHPNNNIVAELGIGTNKNAKNVFNTLEAEKIFNTCHIAIGDNSTFGGENRATVHLDFVIFEPTMRWL